MATFEIYAGNGKYAIIDKIDLPLVNQYSWSVSAGYAIAQAPTINGKRSIVSMSRLIAKEMGFDSKLKVDHENQNTLDNRRDNLREATGTQNNANRSYQSNSTTLAKGVFQKKKKFEVRIGYVNKNYYIGLFALKIDAEYAYWVAAQLLFQEFAFVKNTQKFEILSDGWKKKIEIQVKCKLNLL